MLKNYRTMKQLILIILLLCGFAAGAQNKVVSKGKKRSNTSIVNSRSSKSSAKKVISVGNAREFIKAIGSNRTIRINAGFNLTPAMIEFAAKGTIMKTDASNPQYTNPGVYICEGWGEKELVFYNIHNLTIEGVHMRTAHIQTSHTSVFVMRFEECTNVKLKNLTLGHVPAGYCGGGVVDMKNCRKCTIEHCDLYGCGTYGICAERSEYCYILNSTIRDCSEGIMTLDNCYDFHFNNCKLIRNKEFDLIRVSNCSNIDFTNCEIALNKGVLFKLDSNVTFKECKISHDANKMGTTNYIIRR